MGINRYSNLSQAKFNPMSFQELSMLPFTQRKQHDAATAQAEQARIIESQYMDADKEAVEGAINAFQNKTDDYINKLDSEGFKNSSRSDIRDLVRERKELMTTGIPGRKQAQYDRYAANMKQLDKDRDKISPYKYQALQQKAVEDYTKAVKEDPNASYRDVLAVKDHDIQKDARQIALDVQKNPQILTDFGFTPIPGAPGQYWNSKTQTKYTGEGDIANAIYSIMGQNREVMDDLYQREQLDLLGDQSATDYLKNVGLSFEGYGVNQVTKSRSGFTNQMQLDSAKRKVDDDVLKGNLNFEKKPQAYLKIEKEHSISTLNNILNGKVHNSVDYLKPSYSEHRNDIATYNRLMKTYNELKNKEGNKFSINDLSDTEKNNYTNIYKGLIKTGQLNPDSKLDSTESIKAVKDYYESQGNVYEFQNKLITDGFTTNYSNKTVGIKASNPQKITENILNNADSREFYNTKTNEVLSYKQMLDKGYLDKDYSENLKNNIISGYYDVESTFSNIIGSDKSNAFASSYSMKSKDGNEFLVTRSASELESPAYQADADYGEIFTKTQLSPNIPHTYTTPQGQSFDIIYNNNENVYYLDTPNPTGGKYKDNGAQRIGNKSDLKNIFRTIYDIE
jgi:hypothetical protein